MLSWLVVLLKSELIPLLLTWFGLPLWRWLLIFYARLLKILTLTEKRFLTIGYKIKNWSAFKSTPAISLNELEAVRSP
jgi:hypothetical protein